MNIAIFGGCFDPITNGHIDVAEYIVKNTDVDFVWITPCYKHLFDKKMTAPEIRLKMCYIVCKNSKKVFVSNYEIKHKLNGSSFELIKQLRKEYSKKIDLNFSFVIGMDNANEIDGFYKYKELINMIRIIVVSRSGIIADPNVDWYLKEPHIYLSDCKIIECSSNMVRTAFENKEIEIAKKLLHKDVFNIIKERKLYTRKMLTNLVF